MTLITPFTEPSSSSSPFVTRVVRTSPSTWVRTGLIKLRFSEGPDRGREIVLEGDGARSLQGGRSPLNDIVLNDEHVSGAHFELVLQPTGVLLRDLESTNGIHVAGARVKEAWIGKGSVFMVGQSAIELVTVDSLEVMVSARGRFGKALGESMVMRELFVALERCARSELPTLIAGEPGTGKELIARALHEHSARSRGRFVAVKCARIPGPQADSWLFGHAKGAFAGAGHERAGCFEEASGGTLFLDEVGELSLELQARLLRVLKDGEVTRIGEHLPRKIHVRVISATRRDLRRMVAEDRFLEALYVRLASASVTLPPLVERVDDILPLAERFLEKMVDDRGLIRRLNPRAVDALRSHRWPGNVRELRGVIERAYFMSEQEMITPEELGLDPWGAADEVVAINAKAFERTLKDAREEIERIYLRRLMASDGTQASKARRAGLTDEGLRQALKRLGLRE